MSGAGAPVERTCAAHLSSAQCQRFVPPFEKPWCTPRASGRLPIPCGPRARRSTRADVGAKTVFRSVRRVGCAACARISTSSAEQVDPVANTLDARRRPPEAASPGVPSPNGAEGERLPKTAGRQYDRNCLEESSCGFIVTNDHKSTQCSTGCERGRTAVFGPFGLECFARLLAFYRRSGSLSSVISTNLCIFFVARRGAPPELPGERGTSGRPATRCFWPNGRGEA